MCTCVEKLRLGGNAARNLKVKVKVKQSLYIPEQVLEINPYRTNVENRVSS